MSWWFGEKREEECVTEHDAVPIKAITDEEQAGVEEVSKSEGINHVFEWKQLEWPESEAELKKSVL